MRGAVKDMSVTIDFAPETETLLQREAGRMGLLIPDLVRQFVEASLSTSIDQGSDEWWEEFLSEEDIADAPAVPPPAMSREVLYADRGY